MLPTLFGLPTYTLTFVGAFFLGAWLAERDARRRGHSARAMIDACALAIVVGILCGWGLPALRGQPRWSFDYYGGFFGGVLGAWLASRIHGEPWLSVLDTFVPSLSIGHVVGRLGCLMAGCCYGVPTDSSFGIRFPAPSQAFSEMVRDGALAANVSHTPPLHPTQLYEAVGELAIFALLLFARPQQRRVGQVFAVYTGSYALLRSLVETVRADASSDTYLVSGVVFVIAAWLVLRSE